MSMASPATEKTRIMLSVPPHKDGDVVCVSWYGQPNQADLEASCRAAIAKKYPGLGADDPLELEDEDGDVVVLSSTLPTGLQLLVQAGAATGGETKASPDDDKAKAATANTPAKVTAEGSPGGLAAPAQVSKAAAAAAPAPAKAPLTVPAAKKIKQQSLYSAFGRPEPAVASGLIQDRDLLTFKLTATKGRADHGYFRSLTQEQQQAYINQILPGAEMIGEVDMSMSDENTLKSRRVPGGARPRIAPFP